MNSLLLLLHHLLSLSKDCIWRREARRVRQRRKCEAQSITDTREVILVASPPEPTVVVTNHTVRTLPIANTQNYPHIAYTDCLSDHVGCQYVPQRSKLLDSTQPSTSHDHATPRPLIFHCRHNQKIASSISTCHEHIPKFFRATLISQCIISLVHSGIVE